jgi:uncharacterized membrane protein (DUF4010 family)
MDLELARDFLIALAIGGLIGIEREMNKRNEQGEDAFGLRTCVLIALVGAASGWLGTALHPALFGVGLTVTGLVIVASYVVQNRKADKLGLTGEFAALAVFLLAAMAVTGLRELAVALSVVVLAVLAFKPQLHAAVGRLDREDLFAGTKLLIASFVVLPLLPDRSIDPWDAINPSKLWLLVVLVSALSLVGYVGMRWLGAAHGLVITGVAGGMVSSTATTLSLARASKESEAAAAGHAPAAGILLAWLVMFTRVLVLVGFTNLPMLSALWPPMLAMGLACAGFAAWHYRAAMREADTRNAPELPIRNPFSLTSAIKFGLLFAAVLLLVRLAEQYGPSGSVYAVAALSGTVDVDAITLSLAQGGETERAIAATAIVLAALSNTVVKCGMAMTIGSAAVRKAVLAATVVILAAGIAAALLL